MWICGKHDLNSYFQMEFFKSFALEVATTTGYDWSHTSSQTISEEETFDVSVTVEPGQMLKIKQAVGYCGGNSPQTELFVITTTDGNSTVLSERYEKQNPDGSVTMLDAI